MFTGIGIGLVFGCAVFALVWCKGDVLSGLFTADAAVIANSYAYLMGFAPETIATAILFSMVGYFNGNDKTLWVMVQGWCRLCWCVSHGVYYEYPAQRQPDDDRSVRTHLHRSGHLIKHLLFLWLKRYENQTSA